MVGDQDEGAVERDRPVPVDAQPEPRREQSAEGEAGQFGRRAQPDDPARPERVSPIGSTRRPAQYRSGETARKRARGLGWVFQPVYTDRKTRERRCSAIWWIQYTFRGRVHRESSGSANRGVAVNLLRRRLGEMGRGRITGPDVERLTFEDLAQMLLNDYGANGRRSLDRMEGAVAHLRSAVGDSRALDITADRITAYVTTRQATRSANATINRELAALKRMFRLGEKGGKVDRRPHIAMLVEDNVRTGFFEHDEFLAVLGRLPEHLRPVFETAYVTGWRV